MGKIKIIFLLIFPLLCSGQISIDFTSLPTVNDTIWTSTDHLTKVDIGKTGVDRFWNFSNLNSAVSNKQILKKTDPFLYPTEIEYDYMFKSGPETFHLYKSNKDGISEIAVQRPHPLNPSSTRISKYILPRKERSGNLNYGAQENTNSIIYYVLAQSEIPGDILGRIPVNVDSLRIAVLSDLNSEIDASGILKLPDRSIEVLREHVMEEVQTYAEILTAGHWYPVNQELVDPDNELLGREIHEWYSFHSEKDKYPVAKVILNGSGKVEKVIYKANQTLADFVNLPQYITEYILSPNPSFGEVKLELLNVKNGNYKFELYNVIGKKIWENRIEVNRSFQSYQFDLSFLGKGTYLWAISDNNGIRMVTKRVVIITP